MYRIGEIANLMNLSKRTIDYYTQIGLLNPARTDSNYRMYGDESIKILEMVEHYKTLNMPLEEIKSSIEMFKADNCINNEKLEKHVEQISVIMEHLKDEIKEIDTFLQRLSRDDKEMLIKKLSSQGITLAQTLLLLFS